MYHLVESTGRTAYGEHSSILFPSISIKTSCDVEGKILYVILDINIASTFLAAGDYLFRVT